jgi:transglutaminase-like putative cysteine protease
VARTALLYALPAILVATAWARLEDVTGEAAIIGVLLLALVPALVRPWWGRTLAVVGVALVAVDGIFGIPVTDARPFDERDFFGPLADRFRDGFLAYYDVPQPFAVAEQPLMHDIVLTAVFGFAVALALAIAARRPLIAATVLLVASIWPATLVPGNDLGRGAVTLAAVLGLLAFGGRRPTHALRPAAAAAAILVAFAVGASTSEAVAKPGFVAWKSWDLYDKPSDPVGVDFVWDATYGPLKWPEEETTVLTVSGPNRSLYWRAATLDTFTENRWVEDPTRFRVSDERTGVMFDPLFPQRGRRRSGWTKAEVKIEALRDDHLVGASMPAFYDPGELGEVAYFLNGTAVVADGLDRGDEYTVWSYAPRPKPKQLAEVEPLVETRRRTERPFLEVGGGRAALPFGAPRREREERLEKLFESGLTPYEGLYLRAREIVGEPPNQYTAVLALEAWFRSEGGFVYDETPPQTAASAPPLVDFALRHQRGYCQFYAGAMALMLRYLGIPARVAVGFTSGTPNEDRTRWTVTDHDAHAWVEVWFRGWGWLPFDPTPARGQLSNPYSFGASNFDFAGARDAIGGEAARGQFAQGLVARLTEERVGEEFFGGPDVPGRGLAPVVRERGESLLKLLLLVLAVGGTAIALVKLILRRARYLTHDARKLASACRLELVDFLSDQRIEVVGSATPRELAAELHRTLAVDAGRFAQALAAARYAPPGQSRAGARRARRELRALKRQIRGALGVPRRVRGVVSLRSLAA